MCGITTLDFDHTSVLGNTIESIAWNKSGIMKPGVPTFTVEQPLQSALHVLIERAKEKEVCGNYSFIMLLQKYCTSLCVYMPMF